MNLPTREEVRKHPKNKSEGKANGKVNGKLNSSVVKRKRTEEEVQKNPSKRSSKPDENNSRVKYSRNEKSSSNVNGFSDHKELNGIETLEDIDEDDSSSSSSEVSFLKRSFDLKLPNKLRHILVFDHDMITYRQSVPTLPASKSVRAIVDEYLAAAKQTKRGRRSIYLDDTFKFLINVFNDLLDTALIYAKEKPQVNHVNLELES
jgi:hypothetical protein